MCELRSVMFCQWLYLNFWRLLSRFFYIILFKYRVFFTWWTKWIGSSYKALYWVSIFVFFSYIFTLQLSERWCQHHRFELIHSDAYKLFIINNSRYLPSCSMFLNDHYLILYFRNSHINMVFRRLSCKDLKERYAFFWFLNWTLVKIYYHAAGIESHTIS